jgi:uncharacterized damage-inducible protein DinB
MHTLAHHFFAMAANNAWANHRLLDACARLTQEDFEAARTSFFPSIKATLNHIVTVDWYYVDALERALRRQPPNTQPGRFFDPEEPFATCAALSAEQHAVDQRLLVACESLNDPQTSDSVAITRLSSALRASEPIRARERPFALMRSTGVEVESIARLLAHLFQHQIHHRGQVHAMLAGTPVAPPQLDEFFCANEAHLRARELAEIGLSEHAVFA